MKKNKHKSQGNNYKGLSIKNSMTPISPNINNTNLASAFFQQNGITSALETVLSNIDTTLVSNNRVLLAYMYIKKGIIQTIIDIPIEDAFRGGLIYKTNQVDAEDLKKVYNYIQERNVLKAIIQTKKWVRLFGGGGIVISEFNELDGTEPFDIDNVKQGDLINFYPADLWELNMLNRNQFAEEKPYIPNMDNPTPYLFYGKRLHKTRVLKMQGKEAPAQIRQNLRGWGMSEIEKIIQPLADFEKLAELTADYIDEGKIDVFKIDEFNAGMLNKDGIAAATAKMAYANMFKSKYNGLVMDKNDDFVQKQISFAGVPEFKLQNRIELASALKMPMSKIFGLAASGFSSGEDDIENYNAMIESQIRTQDTNSLHQISQIVFKVVLGYVPDDLEIDFHPLRVLGAEQEEKVKNDQLSRIISIYDRGLITSSQVIEQLNSANLLPVSIQEESKDDFPTPPPQKPKLDLTGDSGINPTKLSNSIWN